MPQLMPLYWIISTVMLLLLYLMILKIYGNHSIMAMLDYKEINKMDLEKWYW